MKLTKLSTFLIVIPLWLSCNINSNSSKITKISSEIAIEDSVVLRGNINTPLVISDSICCFSISNQSTIVFANFYTGKTIRVFDYKTVQPMNEWAYQLLAIDTTDSLYKEHYAKKNKIGALGFSVANIQLMNDSQIIVTHYLDYAAPKLQLGVHGAPDTLFDKIMQKEIASIFNTQRYTIDSIWQLGFKHFSIDPYFSLVSDKQCYWDFENQILYSSRLAPLTWFGTITRKYPLQDFNLSEDIENIYTDTCSFDFERHTYCKCYFSKSNNKQIQISVRRKIYDIAHHQLLFDAGKILPDLFQITNFKELDNHQWLIQYLDTAVFNKTNNERANPKIAMINSKTKTINWQSNFEYGHFELIDDHKILNIRKDKHQVYYEIYQY